MHGTPSFLWNLIWLTGLLIAFAFPFSLAQKEVLQLPWSLAENSPFLKRLHVELCHHGSSFQILQTDSLEQHQAAEESTNQGTELDYRMNSRSSTTMAVVSCRDEESLENPGSSGGLF